MRKLFTALIVVAVLIAVGCATESGVSGAADSGDKVAAVGAEKTVEENVQVTEIINIPYIVKETSFFNDGYVESYKVYAYDDNMNPAREDLFNSFDEIIESVVYENLSVNKVKRSLYNSRGELQSWKMISKTPSGLVSRSESYSGEGNLQTVSEFTYDSEDRKIGWQVFDKDEIVLSSTKYIYEAGLNTRIEIYDIAMNLREYFQLEYADGLLVKNSHYGDKGELVSAVEYVITDNSISSEKHLRANGSTSRTVKFINDDNGSPVKAEYFDGNGKLKEWTETEYEYISEEITVRK